MRAKTNREKLPHHEAYSIPKSFFVDLPQDIISYILTFLPVKTLIRFRCVCKSWLNLTLNPDFIKNHLQKASFSNYYTNHKLILRQYDTDHRFFIKSLSLDLISDDNKHIDVLDYPTGDDLRKIRILGSCNGLVWIAIEDVGAFLWNPSTRISRQLTNLVPKSCYFYRMYGFGYDQINDDYKLVWMVSARGVTDEKEVKIYSLRTNSLKKIPKFPHDTLLEGQGIYVNGVLHWPIMSMTSIVSLNLGSEAYGEITQPCYGKYILIFMSLGILEGCLAVFCNFKKPKKFFCLDIWVMKEYGVIDSWIKLYTIKQDLDRFFIYYPLCITVSGEILLESGWWLILYNPTNSGFRKPRVGKLSTTEVFTYVESLVSPNITDEMRVDNTKSKVQA